MPLKNVSPSVFVKHKGIKVFHAYKNGEFSTPYSFVYTTDVHEREDFEFDVRELPLFGDSHQTIIQNAIDKGLLKIPDPNIA